MTFKHQLGFSMKKNIVLIPCVGIILSSCGINDTFQALEANREAVDMSTYAIQENIQAVEAANRSIAENRRQLEEINKALKKAAES